jgi:hypothetical protein
MDLVITNDWMPKNQENTTETKQDESDEKE